MVRSIAVVGAGQMGTGIAALSLLSGCAVVLVDMVDDVLNNAKAYIDNQIQKQVDKGLLNNEQHQWMLLNIHYSKNFHDLVDHDLILEAVSEDLNIKAAVFNEINQYRNPQTIVASNTSSLSITRLASMIQHPDKVIGIHFMNPPLLMPLVEVIPGLHTTQETVNVAAGWVQQMNKTPILCKDRPGFVVNRLLIPMLNEAVLMLDEGIARPEDIDKAMQLGANHPMGPLALADLIGLDTCLSIMQVLQRDYGDDKYRAAPLLRRYVEAGLLGRKAGRGFYDYTQNTQASS